VAAFMRVAVMLCIVDMLVLVHFPVVIMRMGMLICGMATHRLSPPYQVFFANLAIYSLLKSISELNGGFF
jgi:hypothetical protein